jgi:hypothetical protein
MVPGEGTVIPFLWRPKVDLVSLAGKFANLALVGLRTFILTFLLIILEGVVLASLSYYGLRDYPMMATVAALVAFLESCVIAGFVAARRALILALAHGIRSEKLGQSAVHLLFGRMLGVSATAANPKPFAQALERLPLAQAEARLTHTVDTLLPRSSSSGLLAWLQRQIQARLLHSLQVITLAKFREQGAKEGGVNLAHIQALLEAQADDWLIARLKRSLGFWTLLVLVGLPLLILGQTFVVLWFLQSHS